jgi:hypothetical protein
MNKYLAKIVYKIVCMNKDAAEQFDEQLCFIEARDINEAFIKARMLGVKNEDEVDHESGNSIFWKFVDVPFLKIIENLADGDELYASISEHEKDDNYEAYIKSRAADLQMNFQQQLALA